MMAGLKNKELSVIGITHVYCIYTTKPNNQSFLTTPNTDSLLLTTSELLIKKKQ